MANTITNHKCPACMGPLNFSSASGKLECEYCDSSFTVEEIEKLFAQQEQQAAGAMEEAEGSILQETPDWDTSQMSEDWGEDADTMRSYSCPSCGAELICDATTAATACPYCGNPTIIPGQFRGALKPDHVIPFKLEKQDAIAALKRHYKGKLFLPNTFLDTHTIEKIQGVYVPFWLFDGCVSGEFLFHGTHSHRYRRGDKEITEINHFLMERQGSMEFEKVPVDASSKMPDAHMDAIEPFYYEDMKPFSTAYLPGFLADKYDLTEEQTKERADQRCIQSLENAMYDTVLGYEMRDLRRRNVSIQRGKAHYALLPVWLLSVRWENEVYLFAVNGQTGKTAGDLPVSRKKVMAFFAALAAPLSALAAALACILV